ncbi:hypothetical protein [Nocardia ignorata]|uniref:Uncharacterized protein n=1 Tax=Nocardia ignorata TaxID=145285 RepID=A0A4R6NZ24_NOCIG|nr:hypothetical protein [Nocardia ignorata]TDP29879.1 hypothetical protein DFR75_112148 [Nocardia ignorata]
MTVDDIHVTPRADLIQHTLTGNCVCGPDLEMVKDLQGATAGWVHIHHSLDNREHIERIGIQENPN